MRPEGLPLWKSVSSLCRGHANLLCIVPIFRMSLRRGHCTVGKFLARQHTNKLCSNGGSIIHVISWYTVQWHAVSSSCNQRSWCFYFTVPRIIGPSWSTRVNLHPPGISPQKRRITFIKRPSSSRPVHHLSPLPNASPERIQSGYSLFPRYTSVRNRLPVFQSCRT